MSNLEIFISRARQAKTAEEKQQIERDFTAQCAENPVVFLLKELGERASELAEWENRSIEGEL